MEIMLWDVRLPASALGAAEQPHGVFVWMRNMAVGLAVIDDADGHALPHPDLLGLRPRGGPNEFALFEYVFAAPGGGSPPAGLG